jgi:aspartyl-tRNA(Asn)/glutamyl-tRNA(Gln) amidotransferase subunit A
MPDHEIGYMSAFDMAAAIKAKKLSPVEVMEAILARIERLNPRVNAYCTLLAQSAREEAKDAETAVMKRKKLGPLHGVPVSIKDLIFTKGVRTTFGSRIYENFIPPEDAVVVERLKAAGAIIVGKTNTPEFGFMGVTDNLILGPTRNPWNLGLTAGGSSGGAATAVAAGLGLVAIGTDAGGSIRIPSSFCGVFGLKPSFGRVPRGPGFPDWHTLSHTGPITRVVRDAALVMEVIAGRDDRDRHSLPGTRLRYSPFLGGDLKGLRIAWSPDLGYAIVDPQVLEITTTAVGVFEMLGAKLEATNPPVGNPGRAFSLTWGIMLATRYGDKLAEWREQMNPRLVAMIERNMNRSVAEFAQAAVVREEYYTTMRPFFEKYDLLLTPTVAVPPFEVGKFEITEIAGVKGSPALDWMPFTYPFNFTGQPAASVPCGWTADGRPIGLQIVGRPLDDVTVLRAAAAFEQASPWAGKYPPLD